MTEPTLRAPGEAAAAAGRPRPATVAADALRDWLIARGVEGTDQQRLLGGYCRKLVELGLPLLRAHVAQSGFHPKYGGIGFDWTRDGGTSNERYDFTETPRENWRQSPFYHMLEQGLDRLRRRLEPGRPDRSFPLLAELARRGARDYYARALVFEPRDAVQDAAHPIDPDAPPEGLMISWTADGAAGFRDDHLALLDATLPALGLALKSASNRQMAQDLLGVYLGRDAGRRVLSGEIRRGSLQEVRAALLYFDLAGFTAMAERLPGADMIAMLNAYFALVVETVQGRDGHVLKFMGDGLLAMFDQPRPRDAADAALDSAQSLLRDLERLNRARETRGLPVARATLALHEGKVLYGNIGAETRLDFTAIGPAVNLTARLAGMHRALERAVIVSDDLCRAATPGRHDLVSLGRYALRGVSEPRELFTLLPAPEP